MKLVRLLGVEVHLHNGFLALLGLFFAAGVLERGLAAFFIVFIHELAHVAAARRLGVKVVSVELLPFGGVSRLGEEVVLDPRREVLVALAGPAANLVMFGLGLGAINYGLFGGNLGSFFLQCNLLVGAFNLLPALPLDGGRVFRAWLAGRVGLKEGTYRAALLGQFFGVLISAGGVAGMAGGLCGLDVAATGIFLLYAATREKNLAFYHFFQHLVRKKGELASGGVLPVKVMACLGDVSVKKVYAHFLPKYFHLILVLGENFDRHGTLSEDRVIDALLAGRLDAPLGELLDVK